MIDQWLAGLEATWLARSLRDSVWMYPLVNTGHIAGVALLVGSIVPLDLRLLALWQSWPLAPLWHVLTRTAAAGLAMAILFGSLLFIARATEYAASPFFLAKMIVVFAAVMNAIALRAAFPSVLAKAQPPAGGPSRHVRVAALFSLIAWVAALTLGRLVGYF